MSQVSREVMIDVQQECDEILLDYFGGDASRETIERAADSLMRSLKAYDRGPQFGRLVIREFNKRAREAPSGAA